MLIIHGDNIIASREYFLNQRHFLSAKTSLLELSGQDLTYPRLIQSLTTPDLFGQYPLVSVENLFSRRPSSDKKKITEYLQSFHAKLPNLLIYEAKDISLQLKSYPPETFKNFPLPKYLYTFLETFSPEALRKCLKFQPPELIMASLAKHLHNLILVKEHQGEFPSWQSAKLSPQAQKYSLTDLLSLQNQLLQIDLASKTSQNPLSLNSALELWCLKNI